MTFLGQEIAATAEFAAALTAAEQSLQTTFDNLSEDDRLAFFSSQPTDSLSVWCGINEPFLGHTDLKAIDINVSANPYIATRTGDVFGGEDALPQLLGVRQDAVAACDRATQFFRGSGTFADLAGRRPGESTASVYERFRVSSENLVSYLSFAFNSRLTFITRAPAADIDSLSADDLASQLAAELKPKDTALADLTTFMGSDEFTAANPNFPLSPADQYTQILRDYEHVRIPMEAGDPSATPAKTRNPLNGFLNFRVDLAVALCDTSLMRWGACDFGAPINGDMMHFDIRLPRPR